MAKKSQIIPNYNMDFEIFDWRVMHNQADQRYWRDIDNQRLDLEDQLRASEMIRNKTQTALYSELLVKLRREEEEAKREAYIRWLSSPDGQAYIKKYNDRQYFVRVKSINFLVTRPYNLLARKNLESITFKNYISVIFWIFILASSFIFNPARTFGLFESIIIPIIAAIFVASIFILIFYFVYFEIRYFSKCDRTI